MARLPDDLAHPSSAIDGIAARRWWPALGLAILDTGAPISDLLSLAPKAFDRGNGTLRTGLLVYQLRAVTAEALLNLRLPGSDKPRLFPWRLDGGHEPFCMLYRAYKTILFRAGLPHVTANMLGRLRLTSTLGELLFDQLEIDLCFRVREGKPEFRRAPRRRDPKTPKQKKLATARPAKAAERICVLQSISERTLMWVLENRHAPLRLKAHTAADYRSTVRRLGVFLGHTPTVDELCDDLIESYMAWRLRTIAPERVNSERGTLLAIWKTAWRKKMIFDLPRNIIKVRVPKREPEAWSQDELAAILRACRAARGFIGMLPASIMLELLVMLFYDTGLRAKALISLESSAVDLESGWVRVPFAFQKQYGEQMLRVHADTLSLLRQTSPETRAALIPVPFVDAVRYLRDRYKKALRDAGIRSGPRDLFHKLRRTSATFCAAAGGEEAARRKLGHSDVHVTRRYIDKRFVGEGVPIEAIQRPTLPQEVRLVV